MTSTTSSTARYIVGIDLGTTNIALSYVDLMGQGDLATSVQDLPITQLVAPGEVAQGAPHIMLGRTALIGDSCVEEVDACVEGAFHYLARGLLVNGPAVLSCLRVAKTHASQADARHAQV